MDPIKTNIINFTEFNQSLSEDSPSIKLIRNVVLPILMSLGSVFALSSAFTLHTIIQKTAILTLGAPILLFSSLVMLGLTGFAIIQIRQVLKQDNEDKTKKLDAFKQLNNQKLEELTSLKSQNNALQNEIETSKEQANQLNLEIKRLEEFKSQQDILQIEIEALKSKLSNIEITNQKELEDLNFKMEKSKEQANNLNLEIKRLEEFKSQQDSLQSEIEALKSKLSINEITKQNELEDFKLVKQFSTMHELNILVQEAVNARIEKESKRRLLRNNNFVLPNDVVRLICSNLTIKNMKTFALVTTQWSQAIASKEMRQYFKNMIYLDAVNPKDYIHQFGNKALKLEDESVAVKELPDDIGNLYFSDCTIFSGKKWGQTHDIVWLQAGLTSSSFDKLTKLIEVKQSSFFDEDESKALERNSNKDLPIQKSGWVAITKYPIPGSAYQSINSHQTMIKNIKCIDNGEYDIPETIEAMICSTMTNLKSPKHFDYLKFEIKFENINILCKENDNAGRFGVYFLNKLHVNDYYSNSNSERYGAYAVRKLEKNSCGVSFVS